MLEPFEDRNRERGRLAGAGAGLAEHVDAGQRAGNDAGLTGVGSRYAARSSDASIDVREAQIAEAGRGCGRVGIASCRDEAVKAARRIEGQGLSAMQSPSDQATAVSDRGHVAVDGDTSNVVGNSAVLRTVNAER